MFEKSFRPLPEPVVEISVGANVFLTLKIIIIFSPREFSLPVNTKAEYVWHKQVNKLMLYGAAALSRTGVPVTGCSVVGLSRDGAETMLFRLHHEITCIKYILFIFKSSSLHSS